MQLSFWFRRIFDPFWGTSSPMQSQYVFRIFAPRLARMGLLVYWAESFRNGFFFPRKLGKEDGYLSVWGTFFLLGISKKHQHVANIAVAGFSKSGSPVETYIILQKHRYTVLQGGFRDHKGPCTLLDGRLPHFAWGSKVLFGSVMTTVGLNREWKVLGKRLSDRLDA